MNEDLEEVREHGMQKSGRRMLQGEAPGDTKSPGLVHTCCVQRRAEGLMRLQEDK